MKNIFALMMLVVASVTLSAQEPVAAPKTAEAPVQTVETKQTPKIEEPNAVCDLGLQNSPIIHGLQLGMSEVEASLKIRSQFEKDPANASLQRASAKFTGDPIFENVESASLTSSAGKVSAIRLSYNTKWPNIKDFVWGFAPKLGLIRIGFRLDNERREAKSVCKDFTVEMKSSDAGSELIIVDTRDPKKVTPPTGD